jgi:hypothetical protein
VKLPRTTPVVAAFMAGTCARYRGEGDNWTTRTPSNTGRVAIMLGITRRRLAVARCRISNVHRASAVAQPHDVSQSIDHKCTIAAQTLQAITEPHYHLAGI